LTVTIKMADACRAHIRSIALSHVYLAL